MDAPNALSVHRALAARYRRSRGLPRAARAASVARARRVRVDLDGAVRARGDRRAARRLHGPRLVRRGAVRRRARHRAAPVRAEGGRRGERACGSSPGSCPHCSTCRPRRCVTRVFRWTRCTPYSPGAASRHWPRARPRRAGSHRPRRRGSPAPRPNPGCARPRPAAGAAVARPRRPRTTLGWTTRTLHRRCLTAFGYGPSVLRRVLRFRRAVALLRAGVAPAEVAARAGYADQPHLSRDVRAFAGVSPLGWRRHTPSRAVAPAGRGATTEPACDDAEVRRGPPVVASPDRRRSTSAQPAARAGEQREQVDARAVRVVDRRRSASPRTRRTAPARRGVRPP